MIVGQRSARAVVTVTQPRDKRRPRILWPLLSALAFLSIGGFIGGISFVVDRTGAGIGAPLSWLDETPVSDFLLPGLFLLVVYGSGSLILMIGLVWQPSPGVLRRLDRWIGFHWSWTGTIVLGVAVVVWILYEFTIFPDRTALQPLLLGVGALMVAIPLVPSMRSYSKTVEAGDSG